MDLTCVVAAIGRVPIEDGHFGIIDRSLEEVWPTVHESIMEAMEP